MMTLLFGGELSQNRKCLSPSQPWKISFVRVSGKARSKSACRYVLFFEQRTAIVKKPIASSRTLIFRKICG